MPFLTSRFSFWASSFSFLLEKQIICQINNENLSKLRLAQGKQNLRDACLKGKVEFFIFFKVIFFQVKVTDDQMYTYIQ